MALTRVARCTNSTVVVTHQHGESSALHARRLHLCVCVCVVMFVRVCVCVLVGSEVAAASNPIVCTNPIHTSAQRVSLSECEAKCNADTACNYFDYYSGTQVCITFTACDSRRNSADLNGKLYKKCSARNGNDQHTHTHTHTHARALHVRTCKVTLLLCVNAC